MNDIFTEKTIGSISGVELKKKITAVADECYSKVSGKGQVYFVNKFLEKE